MTNLIQEAKIHTLVLEGGGVLGNAYIGAWKALEEYNIMSNVKQIIGSSAGAIIAGLMALGFTSEEAQEVVKTMKFKSFEDYSYNVVKDMYRICNDYGFCAGDKFSSWYREMISKKANPDITFQQLYEKNGITLAVTGTNVNYRRTDYFTRTTTPDMPIWQAVRISMSIPLIFKAVHYNDCIYVDGGTINNYPFWYFKQPSHTLGLRLMDLSNEKEDAEIHHNKVEIKHFKDYLYELVDTMRSEIERLQTKHMVQTKTQSTDKLETNPSEQVKTPETYWDNTVAIDTFDISAVDFDITKEQEEKLEKSGYDSTVFWLKKNGY